MLASVCIHTEEIHSCRRVVICTSGLLSKLTGLGIGMPEAHLEVKAGLPLQENPGKIGTQVATDNNIPLKEEAAKLADFYSHGKEAAFGSLIAVSRDSLNDCTSPELQSGCLPLYGGDLYLVHCFSQLLACSTAAKSSLPACIY